MVSSLNERQKWFETAWLSFIGYLESRRSVKTFAELYQVPTRTVSNSWRRTLQTGWKCERLPEVRSSTDLTTPVKDRLECGMVHQWRSPTSCCAICAWRGIRTPSSGTIRPIRHVLVTTLLSVFEGAQQSSEWIPIPSPGHMGPTTLSEL